MRRLMICLLSVLALMSSSPRGSFGAGGEVTSETNRRLQRIFEQFPEADENADGILTEGEARRFRAMLRALNENLDVSTADIKPDFVNVPYGPHPRNVMDVWLAESAHPAPVVVYAHGGGFISGDKRALRGLRLLSSLLESGVSVVSINYPFVADAPLHKILRDGARAVQFVRMQADEYRIDPNRVAIIGSSAGAGIALWTAFHDDVADPSSPDPVLRHASRVTCVGAVNPQATYDTRLWARIMGPPPAGRLPGVERYMPDESVQANPDLLDTMLKEVSMIDHISADDPPVFLMSRYPDTDPITASHYKHHPNHVRALEARCAEMGVPCEVAMLSDGMSGRLSENRLILFLLRNLDVPLPAELSNPMDGE